MTFTLTTSSLFDLRNATSKQLDIMPKLHLLIDDYLGVRATDDN